MFKIYDENDVKTFSTDKNAEKTDEIKVKQFCWPTVGVQTDLSLVVFILECTTQSKVGVPCTMPHVSISPCIPTLPHAVRFF